MSEFPEWIERKYGVWWDPSYEEAQDVHAAIARGEYSDPRGTCTPIWWRTLPWFDRRQALPK